MAEAHLAAVYNREGSAAVVDNYTYVICGDGCLQEGVSSEACSLAGHLGLGKLIVFYDDNQITIDGETGLSFTEDVGKRYEAYGWHVQTVEDTHDLDALLAATDAAQAVTDKPSLIKVGGRVGWYGRRKGYCCMRSALTCSALARHSLIHPSSSTPPPQTGQDRHRVRLQEAGHARGARRALGGRGPEAGKGPPEC